jgi:hypothetical protein
MSGGPIIINEDNEFKVIGLHQGCHMFGKFGSGLLLTDFGKNPAQILS